MIILLHIQVTNKHLSNVQQGWNLNEIVQIYEPQIGDIIIQMGTFGHPIICGLYHKDSLL